MLLFVILPNIFSACMWISGKLWKFANKVINLHTTVIWVFYAAAVKWWLWPLATNSLQPFVSSALLLWIVLPILSTFSLFYFCCIYFCCIYFLINYALTDIFSTIYCRFTLDRYLLTNTRTQQVRFLTVERKVFWTNYSVCRYWQFEDVLLGWLYTNIT